MSDIKWELEVRARHLYAHDSTLPAVRDVYVREVEGAQRIPFLMHTHCPVSRVRDIIQWFGSLPGMMDGSDKSIVYDPPGNMEPGWEFPRADPPAPPPVAVTMDPALEWPPKHKGK